MKPGRLVRRTPLRSRTKRGRGGPVLAVWCEARTDVCTGRAHHRHHLRLRSQGGTDGPTIDVCLACHGHIHNNPSWSYAHGFLLRGTG